MVAVDLPSGLPSDTGDLPWPAVPAALTVTFGAAKHGHVLPPACDRVGELRGRRHRHPRASVGQAQPNLFLLEPADVLRGLPRRAPGAHKGTFGHVLVIAGSVGKTGAAVLAATGALRAGVGLVTVATPVARAGRWSRRGGPRS